MPTIVPDPEITTEVYRAMGLSDAEYQLILDKVGRPLTYTELGMFAVMWSEHCGYKCSKNVLKLFKRYAEAVDGAGLENAGIVDIGDGLGIVMKMESHNHPSAVEPHNGAATGVGGILRDIFTMGARPIASLNSLRFGPITLDSCRQDASVTTADFGRQDAGVTTPGDVERNRYLFEHVVAGIGGYGNCVGVPTVGGEVVFHPRYSGPLVNAMAVGILRLDSVASARAEGIGNPVIYVGSSTGRDGIHGATFASDTLEEDSAASRPNVQIGDPFAEKLLIEATLEALASGDVVAIQDMGAAGLTCSTCEMSAKGGVGMEIELRRVPLREQDMSAYEIMLSESQERMLLVARAGREEAVRAIFHKWELNAEVIGQVIADNHVRIKDNGRIVADLEAKQLADECPAYDLPAETPAYSQKAIAFDASKVPEPDDYGKALLQLLSTPSIASKRWVYEQYDVSVQTQTAIGPGADASVLAPRGTRKGIALAVDGNGRYCYFDPHEGGRLAVAEAARNVACTGAMPRAITDCLNFGDPNDPHVYWQFKNAVKGIAEAADALCTPVISGNVSFYNESPGGRCSVIAGAVGDDGASPSILPTPTIGMLGVLEDASHRIGSAFVGERGFIYLLWADVGNVRHEGLGASEYLAICHGIEDGLPAHAQLDKEAAVHRFLVRAAAEGWIESAHDCSDGGLAVAIAECCIGGRAGAHVSLEGDAPSSPDWLHKELESAAKTRKPFTWSRSTAALLFGEFSPRIILGTTAPLDSEVAKDFGLHLRCIGGYDRQIQDLTITNHQQVVSVRMHDAINAYEKAIPNIMEH